MNEIMTTIIETYVYKHVVLICLTVAAMLLAMAVDLGAGIHKAKINGIARTSTGFKKTCEKGRKYFLPLATLIGVDLMACTVLPAPVLTMIWGAYCIFIEFRSIREKAWEKAEMARQERLVRVIVENKTDIARILQELAISSPPDQEKQPTPEIEVGEAISKEVRVS